MIQISVNGGLGNQMLQYCAGKSLARKLGTELYLDLSWYESNNKRVFLLDKFKTDYKIGSFKLSKYYEKPFYESLPLVDNIHLIGYFHNPLYQDKEVYKDFSPKFQITKFNNNAVSIHVRRDDKVNSKKHYALDLDYYKQAMKLIESQTKNIEYFVFSDDLEYCKEIFKNANMRFLHYNTVFDLILQSYCKHNIIANSSFSWWSAMLNTNPDKIVIAPKKYYRDGENLEIYPKEWSLI